MSKIQTKGSGYPMTARLYLFGLVLFVCACVPRKPLECPVDVSVTSVQEPGILRSSVYVGYEPEETARRIVAFFNERHVLAYFWRDVDALRIRTEPLPETDFLGELRRSFIFVRVGVATPSPHCSMLEVRWLTERRGLEDFSWHPSVEPENFEPLFWRSFEKVADMQACVAVPP